MIVTKFLLVTKPSKGVWPFPIIAYSLCVESVLENMSAILKYAKSSLYYKSSLVQTYSELRSFLNFYILPIFCHSG